MIASDLSQRPGLHIAAGAAWMARRRHEQIIKCASKCTGLSGLARERTYEEALALEMLDQRVRFARQVCIPVHYKGRVVGDYDLDFVVADTAVVEVKAVERFDRVFEAQCSAIFTPASCLRGVNFNSRRLVDGLRRFIR